MEGLKSNRKTRTELTATVDAWESGHCRRDRRTAEAVQMRGSQGQEDSEREMLTREGNRAPA